MARWAILHRANVICQCWASNTANKMPTLAKRLTAIWVMQRISYEDQSTWFSLTVIKRHWVSNDCNLWPRTNLFSSSFASLSKIPGYFLFIMVFVTIIHFCLLRFLNWIFYCLLLVSVILCLSALITDDEQTNLRNESFFPDWPRYQPTEVAASMRVAFFLLITIMGFTHWITTLSKKILYFHVTVTFTNINTASPIFWTYEHLYIEYSYTFLGWYLD